MTRPRRGAEHRRHCGRGRRHPGQSQPLSMTLRILGVGPSTLRDQMRTGMSMAVCDISSTHQTPHRLASGERCRFAGPPRRQTAPSTRNVSGHPGLPSQVTSLAVDPCSSRKPQLNQVAWSRQARTGPGCSSTVRSACRRPSANTEISSRSLAPPPRHRWTSHGRHHLHLRYL